MNTMTAVQLTNFQVLIARGDALGRKLDMSCSHDCGTPACMMGEAAAMPHFQKQGLKMVRSYGIEVNSDHISEGLFGPHFLGITRDESFALFGSATTNAWGSNHVSGAQWSHRAREILAAHGYPAVAEPIELPTETLEGVVQLEYSALLQRLTAPVRVRG